MKNTVVLAVFPALSSSAHAQLRITEVMFKGMFGEFIEITNMGAALTASQVDDHSYDDSSAVPGQVPFPSEPLAKNQCVIITEVSAAIFTQAWYTEPVTDPVIAHPPLIIPNNTQNIGTADGIHIFNQVSLVDFLSYDPFRVPMRNGPETNNESAVPYVGWDYTLGQMTNYVSGPPNDPASYDHDWMLSSRSVVTMRWQAGNPGQPFGVGPIGSPGVPAFASARVYP